MVHKVVREGWVGLAIPEELAKKIDEVVKAKKHGYRSRQDFVVDAIRKLLRELGYFP